MKKLLFILMFVLVFINTVHAQDTIKIEANEKDIVIGFGEILEPVEGFWVFEIKGSELSLHGNPYNFREKTKKNLPDMSIATDDFVAMRKRHERIQLEARNKFSSEGKDSMKAFLLQQDEVAKYELKGNSLLVEWKNFPIPASIELTIHEHNNTNLPKLTQKQGLEKLVTRFEEILTSGQGLVFGDGYRFAIPTKRKEKFYFAFLKLKEEGEMSLSSTEKNNLPKNVSFFKDVQGRR